MACRRRSRRSYTPLPYALYLRQYADTLELRRVFARQSDTTGCKGRADRANADLMTTRRGFSKMIRSPI